MRAPLLAALCLAIVACDRKDDRTADTVIQRDTAPKMIASVAGFSTPESVRWDEIRDVYWVSNINGNPNQKDNNGFISRLRADGTVDSLKFIAGGVNGVTLNAPKGIAMQGDTLWVSDIDALRAFDAISGAPIASVDLRRLRAVFLNDVIVGDDGAVYITDTGIRFDSRGRMTKPGRDRVFRVEGGTASLAFEADAMGGPNGIAWDAGRGRFVIGPFSDRNLYTWKRGDLQPTALTAGPGGYDGIEVIGDGRILVSSWSDSAVHLFSGESHRRLITGKPSPADIGWDAKRNRVLIPLFSDNVVEIWQIPR